MEKVRGLVLFVGLAVLFSAVGAVAQDLSSAEAVAAYAAMRQFALAGGRATVKDLVLKRDRAQMTFTGTFYFPQKDAGRVTGAVFSGAGTVRIEPPPTLFEKDNLRRMLKTDVIESDFSSAILRFADDTYDLIGQTRQPDTSVPREVQDLASNFEGRLLRETGANFAARVLIALLHKEQPGFFAAQFDGGRRGRFTFLWDPQCRIPTTNFEINGGEKGLVFSYNKTGQENDVWLAFHGLDDYQRGYSTYSDAYNQVETPRYEMTVDLRQPRKAVRVSANMQLVSRSDALRAISFALSESLPESDNLRRKKGMRVTAVKGGGDELRYLQEEWEGGFTVLLPSGRRNGEKFVLEVDAEGDFIYDREDTYDCHFPFVNGEWYPRHGYLSRSVFEVTYQHHKRYTVASAGLRTAEKPAPDDKDAILTTYRIDKPVSFVTFALGPYKIYKEQFKLKDGEVPLEFFSPKNFVAIKEDFVLAEMGNALNFFGVLFGPYPYPVFRAAYHPFGYGQGFASMLLIPESDRASKYTYAFISHETSHQWWGNIVGWRSYRDQWLSEGFAEYSGVLYTSRRDGMGSARELIQSMRDSLKEAPETDTGIGAGKVPDIGPLIMGHRLETRKSSNAYRTLVYNKGGLVLRMLHFLFTNPETGNGDAFFVMMKDFVSRNRDGWATTESFMQVANEHFPRTEIARKYTMPDLNWFFAQWVWQTHVPDYRLEWWVEDQPSGGVLMKGTLLQDNTPEQWVMPLPLVINLDGRRVARTTVLAYGPRHQLQLALPQRPSAVELDPDLWVLSGKTSSKKRQGPDRS